MSEERFKGGFVGIPNALYLANVNDRDSLYAFLRFAGDAYFGGLKTIDSYKRELRMGHQKVTTLLALWKAQDETETISGGFQEDESTENSQAYGEPERETRGKREANRDDPSIVVQKQIQKQKSTSTPAPADLVREVWPDLVAIAASYGKRWSADLTEGRADFIAKLLKGKDPATAADLPKLMHGAYAMWGGRQSDHFNWKKNFRVEVVFQKSKRAQYLEAFEESQAGGDERERFPATMRVLRGGKGNGRQGESVTARLLGAKLDSFREGS